MAKKCLLTKSLWKCMVVSAFLLMLLVAGFQSNDPTANLPVELTEDINYQYHSDTSPADCLLCGDGTGTLLPLYRGQENIGIIDLNTFNLAPVRINQYDDRGKLIEKSADGFSTHITNTGEDGFFFAVTADVNRGYAHGHLSFSHNKMLDAEKAASNLCSDCLNRIMDNCWGDTPLSIGVIDFNNQDIRLLEKQFQAFTFYDYYVSCSGWDNDDDEDWNISLLVFYCPERYQN